MCRPGLVVCCSVVASKFSLPGLSDSPIKSSNCRLVKSPLTGGPQINWNWSLHRGSCNFIYIASVPDHIHPDSNSSLEGSVAGRRPNSAWQASVKYLKTSKFPICCIACLVMGMAVCRPYKIQVKKSHITIKVKEYPDKYWVMTGPQQ